ncbi:cation diffusion facilitator family transporter [Aquibium microcysteis]|uniref:cation diffusion facilitator family transporter n=1 Tax=Aquibium microcysteis TaxID=675281 RepID=UPI00165CFDFE|nr:cation diffusion facilitator family transporter [Aquibium microcysteis]
MAHSHGDVDTGDRRIGWAVAVNVALTFAQIAGGILSGSLSLIADAIHNFSDAASLGIAFVARRISRRPADDRMTFGYARAEIVAALINYTTLIVIGLYLVYEAVMRFITPEPIEGWLVVWIAGIALVIDTVTAVLVYSMSRSSMNIRAAFLHNIADALGSIGVILGGTAIIVFGWLWIDPAITLMIAGYILWQAFREIGGSIRILMQGTPEGVDATRIRNDIERLDGVAAVTHFHIWSIDEDHASVEAHVARTPSKDGDPALLISIRKVLREQHGIGHSTIELRPVEPAAVDENGPRTH